MPAWDRFAVSLPLEQFLPAILLRIFPIQNLEPCAVLALRDVRPELLLGNDALQVQFADSLKQRSSRTVYVIRISQGKWGRDLRQQPPKLLLAIHHSLRPQMLATQ